MLQDFIRHETAQLLGYKNPSDLDVKIGFFQIGMDSIKAVQLKTRIEEAIGLDLPATVTFEYPSIVALVDYITGVAFDPSLSNTLDAEETLVEADATTVSSKDHKQLSEDELVDLLSEKLKKVR
jgi:acyl carrier protein